MKKKIIFVYFLGIFLSLVHAQTIWPEPKCLQTTEDTEIFDIKSDSTGNYILFTQTEENNPSPLRPLYLIKKDLCQKQRSLREDLSI